MSISSGKLINALMYLGVMKGLDIFVLPGEAGVLPLSTYGASSLGNILNLS